MLYLIREVSLITNKVFNGYLHNKQTIQKVSNWWGIQFNADALTETISNFQSKHYTSHFLADSVWKKFTKVKFENSKFEFGITCIPRVRACAFTDHEGVRTTVSLLSNWFKILRGRWPSSVQFTNKVLHSKLKQSYCDGRR